MKKKKRKEGRHRRGGGGSGGDRGGRGCACEPYAPLSFPPLIWTSSVGMRDDSGIVDAESDPREELPWRHPSRRPAFALDVLRVGGYQHSLFIVCIILVLVHGM
ncbi:hypothetical protein QJS10_CPA09g00855 [Acorus calamus]|uniref:Uncharacterized protein n=1 Tax=Acorus calamus TaxID=4465 RepID=A0AAV9E2E5_ACOCL|nr:hypothetical protein QJS10_CPA09g00855 [Acorus calamus]